MVKLKIREIGAPHGVVFPREVLDRLNVGAGDEVFLTPAPDGSWRLTAHDVEFEAAMQAFETVLREDGDILHALAKN